MSWVYHHLQMSNVDFSHVQRILLFFFIKLLYLDDAVHVRDQAVDADL